MILFVTDQVAGAEYIYPLLRKNIVDGVGGWAVVSSPSSARFFLAMDIAHQILEEIDADSVNQVLDVFNPDKLVMSASGRSGLEHAFVRAARTRGVHCTQFVDQWVNVSQRFHGMGPDDRNTLVIPDVILTLDEVAKRTMVSEGLPEEIIRIVGQPYFEAKMIENRPVGHSREGRVLLVTQPVTEFYGDSLGYTEVSFLETALGALSAMGWPWEKVDVRVHPAEEVMQYDHVISKVSVSICVRKSWDTQWSRYSHALGMFSSVMVQSMLAGVNTASLQPAWQGDDLCSLSKLGFIPKLRCDREVQEFLMSRGSFDKAANIRSAVEGSLDRLKVYLDFG